MKAFRKNSLCFFGFGTDKMINLTVCSNCRSLESSSKFLCSKCGKRLSKTNLYDLYKSYHSQCSNCGEVLASSMLYCPHCGIRVTESPELLAL